MALHIGDRMKGRLHTVVAGAPNADGAVSNQGAAYVFARSGTTWTLQQKLTVSGGGTHDAFGASVAVEGDRVVVADPGGATNVGLSSSYSMRFR